MSILTLEEIRKLDATGMKVKLDEIRRELFNIKMKKVTTGIEKPHHHSSLKRNIAQIQTILSEKERGN